MKRRERRETRTDRMVRNVLERFQGVMDLSAAEIRSRMTCKASTRPDTYSISNSLRKMGGVWYNGDGRWYMSHFHRPDYDRNYCPNCGRDEGQACCRWVIDREINDGLVPFHVHYTQPDRAIMLKPEEVLEVILDELEHDPDIEYEEDLHTEVERRYNNWKGQLRDSKRWRHLYLLVSSTHVEL